MALIHIVRRNTGGSEDRLPESERVTFASLEVLEVEHLKEENIQLGLKRSS